MAITREQRMMSEQSTYVLDLIDLYRLLLPKVGLLCLPGGSGNRDKILYCTVTRKDRNYFSGLI